MSKLDDILDLVFVRMEDHHLKPQFREKVEAAIKALIKDIIGHKVRSRFDDDYGGRKFADGYNQAKAEQLKRLEKL